LTRRGALTDILRALALLFAGTRPLSAAEDGRIRFSELYGSSGPLGLEFSEEARRRRGRTVLMRGFLAPPLKAEAPFFVLTAQPVSLCPFCQSDADWPQDIVVVYPRSGARIDYRSSGDPVEVAGVLELGSRLDPGTGFVSQVRLVQATLRRI